MGRMVKKSEKQKRAITQIHQNHNPLLFSKNVCCALKVKAFDFTFHLDEEKKEQLHLFH